MKTIWESTKECYGFAWPDELPHRKIYYTDEFIGREEPNMDVLPFVVAVAIICGFLVLSGLLMEWGLI